MTLLALVGSQVVAKVTPSAVRRSASRTLPAWKSALHAVAFHAVKVFVVFTDVAASVVSLELVAHVTGGA